jgi:hypothetical protein
MTYLLDVNTLVALGFAQHEFHDRVACWLRSQQFPPLATCSITELGFIRVLAQAPVYGFTIAQARTLLLRLKDADVSRFTFIPDDHDVSDDGRPLGKACECKRKRSCDSGRKNSRSLSHP